MIEYDIRGMSDEAKQEFFAFCKRELGFCDRSLQAALNMGNEEILLNKYYLWIEGQIELNF